MKLKHTKMAALAATLITFGSLAGGANGATTAFFQVGSDVTTFNMSPGETRETLFQAINTTTLSELGARIDPVSSSAEFRWRIFNSNVTGNFGATVLDQTVSYTDVGLAIYDTPITINVSAGNYYILSLQSLSSAVMSRANESDQALPFTTLGGDFLVLDGGGNQNFGNTILPSFSVTVIPEPSSSALLGLGGLALMLRRRRQRHRYSISS